jgi:outer membrane protein OmpA-like peptidoglycan-associated protein
MKPIVVALFIASSSIAQTNLKIGDKAPACVLNMQHNSIQSFPMPYLGRVVLIHFWNNRDIQSQQRNIFLSKLANQYKNSLYRNAEGFEIITIAVQSDKKTWEESIVKDSLTNLLNGIAVKGYNDDVCKKFDVKSVPKDILIDEYGTIISINPRMIDIETILDDKKNYQPIKKELVGNFALAGKINEPIKFRKVYLFNAYGDTITTATTNAKGNFLLNDVKLSQDILLKVDNQINTTTTYTLALYSIDGEHILDGKNSNNGFVFYIPSKLITKLTEEDQDAELLGSTGQTSIIKNLVFKNYGTELTPKDELELNEVLLLLLKNKTLIVDVFTHTDSKANENAAIELTNKQAITIKKYLVKKGINATRIKTESKGRKELIKQCNVVSNCNEEKHKMNRRVVFLIHKN